MSRTFANSVLKRTIVGQQAAPVQFLRFAFGGGEIRATTAPFDVDWDGFTWQGIGGLLRIDPIRETPDDRGGQVGMTLSGVDQSMLSAILAEQYIGRVVEIWFGWVAQSTNLLASSGAESALGNMIVASGGAVVTQDQTHVDEGDYAVKVVCAASNDGVSWRGDSSGNAAPVGLAGSSYTFAVSLAHAEAAAKAMSLEILWRTSGHSNVSTSSLAITVQPGQFQRFALTDVVPATAGEAIVLAKGQAGAMTFWADTAQFGPGVDGLYQSTDGAAIIGGTIIDRPLFVFGGFMNGGFEITENPGENGGTVEIQGRLESRLASLLQSRGFRTNRESHQTVYRTDEFFEFVPGLANQTVVWGLTKKELITEIADRGFRGRRH